MIKNKFTNLLFTSALCFSWGAQADAAITTYTNRSLWEAAVATAGLNLSITENFDTLVGQNFQNGNTLNISSVGLSFTHSHPSTDLDDNIVENGSGSQNLNGTAYARIDDYDSATPTVFENLLIQTTVSNISAFGFDYAGYGSSTETLTSNLGVIEPSGLTVAAPNVSLFFGFIDTDPSNVYTSFSSTGTDGAWGIDNLATATSIPEPSSFLLMSLSACGLLFSRSRKS